MGVAIRDTRRVTADFGGVASSATIRASKRKETIECVVFIKAQKSSNDTRARHSWQHHHLQHSAGRLCQVRDHVASAGGVRKHEVG